MSLITSEELDTSLNEDMINVSIYIAQWLASMTTDHEVPGSFPG